VEASLQKQPIRLINDATNVPELMTWADIAVTGAGTTFWEMCFLGLPAILLVLAENQEGVAAAADERGIASNLGRGTEVSASAVAGKLAELVSSHERRVGQSEKGRKLVDGRGAERVVAFLSDLELRRTAESDCEIFWEWANDPGARAASFRNKAISWEDHTQWFRAKLADPQAILYTVTNKGGLPMGEVRYQIEGKRAVLSISLDAGFRGCGLGQKIVAVATEKLFQDSAIEFVDAYVKPTNDASLKLFTGAGFLLFPSEAIEGQEAVHFVLERSAVA
jgi:RimJ/RimL family protein N-acetyltransferase